MKVAAPRPKTLKPVRPNAGIEAMYRKALQDRIDAMHKSIAYWVLAQYRANTPELAQDDMASSRRGLPANALNRQMRKLADRWQKNFDQGSRDLAVWFSEKSILRSQEQLQSILREAGFSVKFQLTRAARDAYAAVAHENVGLIKSIPEQYLTQVQGLVMRSVTAGRDIGALTKALEKRYAITRRRAAFIARDQSNKATAVITRVRQQELGIETAVWKHSHAGKHPRESHVAFDGKTYEVAKGAFIDGKWIRPGEEPNCRCVSRSVIPGF